MLEQSEHTESSRGLPSAFIRNGRSLSLASARVRVGAALERARGKGKGVIRIMYTSGRGCARALCESERVRSSLFHCAKRAECR